MIGGGIGAALGAWLLAASSHAAPRVVLDRIDLISEAAPDWQRHDLRRLGTYPEAGTVRWLAQITAAGAAGPATFGLSLQNQWIGLRGALTPDKSMHVEAVAITTAFLPTGGRAGLSARIGPVRIGVSLVASSGATWVRPRYGSWSVVPAFGFGIGPNPKEKAPWM